MLLVRFDNLMSLSVMMHYGWQHSVAILTPAMDLEMMDNYLSFYFFALSSIGSGEICFGDYRFDPQAYSI